MNARARTLILYVGLALLTAVLAGGAQARARSGCKAVHAEMVETRSTTECRPGHSTCFVGQVDGNHGLRGTTYFRADSVGTAPPASPNFTPYAGVFEYSTSRGVISTRETGVSSGAEGVVTAFQRITSGTGEFTGLSGFFFVHGTVGGGRVVTSVSGEICEP
jgi:hypothetical protein